MKGPASLGCREEGSILRRLFLELLPSTADSFARSRFEEGERTVTLVKRHFPDLLAGTPRVLDLGSGNGGMLFPFSASSVPLALDTYVDSDLRRFVVHSKLPISQVLATASSLPFADASLDLVLMAEVVEHLAAPRQAAAEVMRVLRAGGLCIVSTPPRLKFLTKPDPHFGIPGLLLLPDICQRALQARLRPHQPTYVHHIYSTTWGVFRLFPRGSCSMHVISHRHNWTRHLSWNYVAFQKRRSAE